MEIYDYLLMLKFSHVLLTRKQKRVQLVNSGIQECEMLKLNHSLQSKSGRRDPEHDDSHLQSCTVNLEGEHQVIHEFVDSEGYEVLWTCIYMCFYNDGCNYATF